MSNGRRFSVYFNQGGIVVVEIAETESASISAETTAFVVAEATVVIMVKAVVFYKVAVTSATVVLLLAMEAIIRVDGDCVGNYMKFSVLGGCCRANVGCGRVSNGRIKAEVLVATAAISTVADTSTAVIASVIMKETGDVAVVIFGEATIVVKGILIVEVVVAIVIPG